MEYGYGKVANRILFLSVEQNKICLFSRFRHQAANCH